MAYQSEREEIEHKKFVDYKDVAYLKQFTNPHAKILSKKRTGVSADKQREVSLTRNQARTLYGTLAVLGCVNERCENKKSKSPRFSSREARVFDFGTLELTPTMLSPCARRIHPYQC